MEKFADWQDAAAEAEAEQRDAAIEEIRRKLAEQKEITYAACQWCGDPSGGKRYCTADCAIDAEKHARMTIWR